jgi:hypothetical protein
MRDIFLKFFKISEELLKKIDDWKIIEIKMDRRNILPVIVLLKKFIF